MIFFPKSFIFNHLSLILAKLATDRLSSCYAQTLIFKLISPILLFHPKFFILRAREDSVFELKMRVCTSAHKLTENGILKNFQKFFYTLHTKFIVRAGCSARQRFAGLRWFRE